MLYKEQCIYTNQIAESPDQHPHTFQYFKTGEVVKLCIRTCDRCGHNKASTPNIN